MTVWLLALALTAPGIAGDACHDKSACNADTSLDETSMLQTMGQVKSRAKVHLDLRADATSQKSNQSARLLLTKREDVEISNSNLIYIRVPKTASTTCCEVNRRVAQHHDLSGVNIKRGWPGDIGEPGVWCVHGALSSDDFGENRVDEPVEETDFLPSWEAVQRLKMPTFLWTTIRDPASRVLSQYYYVKNPWTNITIEDKINYIDKYGGNNQFRYIRPSAEYSIADVVSAYGLIALTERLDDSLVVLAATLKVPLSDVLYLQASKNVSEKYVDGYHNVIHEAHPPRDQEPEEVQHVLNGRFRDANTLDYELYEQANVTLNAKIAEMHLEPTLIRFKQFLAKAQDECKVEGQDKSAVETLVDCFVDDQGCNYKCIDSFRQEGLEMCEWCGDEM
mmetsp:Transcript_124710/g.220968  ORF Transcript_124710/g.220968 Transcript_124710/m.220968 type:complete len:393 (-) Transcript_124710:2-1180(-)